jgi:hypothetical protein
MTEPRIEVSIRVVRGEISPEESEEISRYLGELSIASNFIRKYAREPATEEQPIPYGFDQIHSPMQFLSDEHIKEAHRTLVSPRVHFGQEQMVKGFRKNILPRSDAGFPPHTPSYFRLGLIEHHKNLAQLVVQSGTAVSIIRMIEADWTPNISTSGVGLQQMELLRLLATSQFTEPKPGS